jgi:hypothetical protein
MKIQKCLDPSKSYEADRDCKVQFFHKPDQVIDDGYENRFNQMKRQHLTKVRYERFYSPTIFPLKIAFHVLDSSTNGLGCGQNRLLIQSVHPRNVLAKFSKNVQPDTFSHLGLPNSRLLLQKADALKMASKNSSAVIAFSWSKKITCFQESSMPRQSECESSSDG